MSHASNKTRRLASISIAALAACLMTKAALAADTKTVTLVQSHPTIGVGEEVFLYAVPKALGYFKDEGLDVISQTAKNGVQVGQMLQTGSAQFGTAGTDTLLLSEEQGGNLMAFYHLKQNNGSVVATLETSSIKTFDDMKGKTIGVSSIGYGGHQFLKYELDHRGIKPDQYTAVATGAGPAAAAALKDGKVDALSLWDAMFAQMENNGLKLRYIEYPLMDKIAGLNLVTTKDEISKDPKTVEGMCRAVAKGLHFTLTNPEAALKIFYKVFPTTKPANVPEDEAVKTDVRVLNAWLHYAEMGVPYGQPTGLFTPARFVAYRDYLKEQGNLKTDVDPAGVYTTDFVSKCNDFDRAAVAKQAKDYK
jgi:NitT/TauT family transport system substrate-binding protein